MTSSRNIPEAVMICLKKKKEGFFRNAEKRLVIYGSWKEGGFRREVDAGERM